MEFVLNVKEGHYVHVLTISQNCSVGFDIDSLRGLIKKNCERNLFLFNISRGWKCTAQPCKFNEIKVYNTDSQQTGSKSM